MELTNGQLRPASDGAGMDGVALKAPRGPAKRRARRFSLNGLAIQLSAFAISSTLVALLVVSGSQAALVEEHDSVTNYVPIGAPAEDGTRPRRGATASPSPGQTPAPPPIETAAPSASETVTPSSGYSRPVEESAATIELTDSDAGTALFSEGTVLAPGVSLERCIAVTYDGNADPDPVLLYAATADGALTAYLDLIVEMGSASGDSFGSCRAFVPSATLHRGTLADFAAAHRGAASGLPTWDPAGAGERRSFRFRVSVRDDPAASGLSAAFGFTWESRAG